MATPLVCERLRFSLCARPGLSLFVGFRPTRLRWHMHKQDLPSVFLSHRFGLVNSDTSRYPCFMHAFSCVCCTCFLDSRIACVRAWVRALFSCLEFCEEPVFVAETPSCRSNRRSKRGLGFVAQEHRREEAKRRCAAVARRKHDSCRSRGRVTPGSWSEDPAHDSCDTCHVSHFASL